MNEQEQKDAKDAERRKDMEQISAGKKVEEFLQTPAVADALRRMDKAYFDEFKAASDAQKRQDAWAKSAVMQDFLNELQGIRNSAKVAEVHEEVRVAAESRSQRNPRR